MGYLHEGHLRLVDRARELAERVVVSIFVNPLQFGPHEDLARYPRDLPRDRKLAEARGVDCLFVPETAAMYRAEPVVRVVPAPPAVADTLEGAVRPGHFTASEYYAVPGENLRTYPVYRPDREPPGYWDWLQKQKPQPLVDAAKLHGAELMVLSTHGYTGLTHLVFGSVAEKVVRISPVPVLSIKPPKVSEQVQAAIQGR